MDNWASSSYRAKFVDTETEARFEKEINERAEAMEQELAKGNAELQKNIDDSEERYATSQYNHKAKMNHCDSIVIRQ